MIAIGYHIYILLLSKPYLFYLERIVTLVFSCSVYA